ncbi:MAG: hypothetical protein VX966_00700 [Chloroflexota bacterium]|nr:hypothetical protein [Chloroflexota bacterium]
MSIRYLLLIAVLCLTVTTVSCNSSAVSQEPSYDKDREGRKMDGNHEGRYDSDKREEREHSRDSYHENPGRDEHKNRNHDEHDYEKKPPHDMKQAAERLGITRDELREALGGPPPDISIGAKTLGITEEDLLAALDMQERPHGKKYQGRAQDNPLKIAADHLGISFEEFQKALGGPPPDIEGASRKLGIDSEKIREALLVPPKKGKRRDPR